MKINKDIIRYSEGGMNAVEREQFEILLKNDPAMMLQLTEYKKLISGIDEIKNISSGESYFNSIIPAFRKKESKRKRMLFPRLAAGFTVFIIAAAALFFFSRDTVNKTEIAEVSGYSLEEVDSILGYYPQNQSMPDSLLNNSDAGNIVDDIIASELNITSESIDESYGYNSYSVILPDGLSSEEADILYNEIINKRFF